MNYILYGLEPVLIKQQCDKIKLESKIDPLSWNNYNLEEVSLKTIIDEANSFSLFAEKRGIIVDNAYIFTGTTNKKLPEQDTSLLEQYLKNPNPDTILIFNVIKEKIDVRKKITKIIKETGKIFDLNVLDNKVGTVKKQFGNYKISDSDCRYFINRVGDNFSIIIQDINKIKTYKGNDDLITKKDIDALTTPSIDMNLFHLIENIVSKNTKEALTSYNTMVKYGEEPFVILISLANQFRLFYQVKRLAYLGYSENKIAEVLDVHPFRVKKALEKRNQFSSEQLLTYLDKLGELDYKIKSGQIDKNIGFELFLLGN